MASPKHGGARPGAGRKPGVVSKAKKEIAGEARKHAQDALQTLLSICKSAKAPAAARVSAATALLDRGYGKPSQAIDHSSKDGTMSPPNRIEIIAVDPQADEDGED